ASAKSGGTIISTGNASNCHDYDCGYTFRCDSGVLLFSIRPEDAPEQNGYYRVHSKKGIPEHAWSHVAVIYSVKSNAVTFFINGEQAGQAPAKGRIVFRGCPLWIGAEPKFGGARPFHGFIREVKLYNRALSQDEIKKHFEATKGIASLKLETVEEKRLKALEERCTSTLRVRIIDAGTGEALCARVWVFGPDGKNYFPQKCLFARYRSRNKDKGYFYAFGGFEVKVPPGRIEVVAIRGFEFLPGRERFDLKHGEKKEAVIHMRRLVNMPEKGWWCGDYDIDAYKGSRIKDFSTACAICKAEGLNFVSLCSVPWWRKERCVAKSAHFIAGAGYEPGFAPAGHMDVVWS
ncbi:MAG TPA: LamG domain-containing protein, partial [Desulfobacterales bacterium]|nr:LamG domain-containing protein [Desulfobacterales bacterium]